MNNKEELISLAEYASIHSVTPDAVRRRAGLGQFATARKIGRNWVIDKNEPYIDNRIKSGEYRNWRKKPE